MIEDFDTVVECKYKGETYSVRDNGAVLRHSPIGKKPRPTDDKWTYGKYNEKTGYAEIAGERVHRIVATAFHGVAPTHQHVVDHIDTNRRNNRPENLRWVTKLENILLNPISAKKIIYLCGSIEEFLKDPSKLRNVSINQDFEWMRAVSKEEAAISLERMQMWAKSDEQFSGGTLGEWIYKRSIQQKIIENQNNINNIQNTTEDKIISEEDKLVDASAKVKQKKVLSTSNSKSNPFNFPREETTAESKIILYKIKGELFNLLKAQLDLEKKLMLPNILLHTAGSGLIIKESSLEEYQHIEYIYEGKSRIPKVIILSRRNEKIALSIHVKTTSDWNEINKLKEEELDILDIDLSWAKNGVTEEEMKYILQTDITKKAWINHRLISQTRKMLQKICEPIKVAGEGVLHSYMACPRTSNSVQDIDCWYCNYYLERDGNNPGGCFGKIGIENYQDLLSIVDVKKEDEKIVSVTYNHNGKLNIRNYDKEVQLPGKTLFQLWEENKADYLIAYNIYSDWYVLLDEDPNMSFEKTGQVYAKLGRNIKGLRDSKICSIFGFNNYCWKKVK